MGKNGILWCSIAVFLAAATAVPVATACDEDCDGAVCDTDGLPSAWKELEVLSCRLRLTGGIDHATQGQPTVGCRATCDFCTEAHPPTVAIHGAIPACDSTYPEKTVVNCCPDTCISSSASNVEIDGQGGRFYLRGGGGRLQTECTGAACSGSDVTRSKTHITDHYRFILTRTKVIEYGNILAQEYTLVTCVTSEPVDDGNDDGDVAQGWDFFGNPQSWNICTTEQTNACVLSALATSCQSGASNP